MRCSAITPTSTKRSGRSSTPATVGAPPCRAASRAPRAPVSSSSSRCSGRRPSPASASSPTRSPIVRSRSGCSNASE
jgi:hypothetical protein